MRSVEILWNGKMATFNHFLITFVIISSGPKSTITIRMGLKLSSNLQKPSNSFKLTTFSSFNLIDYTPRQTGKKQKFLCVCFLHVCFNLTKKIWDVTFEISPVTIGYNLLNPSPPLPSRKRVTSFTHDP